MSIISSIKNWLEMRALQKRYRFPKLAEINKAIFVLENEVVDRSLISNQLNTYMKAQEVHEKGRDVALIPYYFELEKFVSSNKPPATKAELTKTQLREMVKAQANLEQMNELFRLVFLPENEQADLLLKPGLVEMLNFLLMSLGNIQLTGLVKQKFAGTPLEKITVKDDGVTFEEVHKEMATITKDEVVAHYKKAYEEIFSEVEKLFGLKAAQTLISNSKQKAEKLYDAELLKLFLDTLPTKA